MYETDCNPHRTTVKIVEKVARAERADPADLEPLYESVDSDAVAELVDHRSTDLEIRFTYEGRRVYVSGDGYVSVE